VNSVFILGNDPRFECLHRRLESRGFSVYRSIFPVTKAAVYLFSFKERETTIMQILEEAPRHSLVLVGKASEPLRSFLNSRQLAFCAILEEKDYLKSNAIATAEGTLAQIIESTPCLLTELKVLICGYGNCGKALAKLVRACGCKVRIFSREESRKQAERDGFSTVSSLNLQGESIDVILNTVEAPLFSNQVAETVSEGTILFQIASGTQGIDAAFLAKRGILFKPLPALPGRYAPETEAAGMERILLRFLSQSRSESE